MEFNIENELSKNGYELDCEKDERTSYLKGLISVSLHWSGNMIDEEGKCISMTIQNVGIGNTDKPIYFGKRPETIEEYQTTFNY